MEYKELSVVISTSKTEEQCQPLIQHLYETCGCNVHVFLCLNNGTVGLTQVYNQMLNDSNVNKDAIVFMHDDVDMLTIGWGRELLKILKENTEYGIIGVAGSKQWMETGMWWSYPKKYGQVIHSANQKTWLTSFSPRLEKDLEEVLVCDGLFFVVDPTRIKKPFNSKILGFDFYEITFCIDNYLEGVKIGVTTNIRVCHHSVGNMRDYWYTTRDIVNEMYGKYYPMDIEEGIKIKNEDVKLYLENQAKLIKEYQEHKLNEEKEKNENNNEDGNKN